MKINYFLTLLLLIPCLSFAQAKLEKQTFLDNKVALLVPAGFKPMSADMMAQKYPNQSQKPDVLLTDENAEVNLIITRTPQPVQSAQMGQYKDFMVSSLKRSHPDAKFLEDGIKDINGKKVGYFKMISPAVDQNVYVMYFFTNVDGKAVIFTFNCTEKLLPQWKDAADSMMMSLKVM